MKFFSFPKIFRPLYKDAYFCIKNAKNTVFPTIDDCTNVNLILQFLQFALQYDLKFSFFCTGKILKENPFLIKRILDNGHILGNHTFSHIDGFKTSAKKYFDDVLKFQDIYKAKIFRPPYGRLTQKQFSMIKKSGLKIIFWDLMTYDFDLKLKNYFILKKIEKKIKNGSIIIFHINNKTEKRFFEIMEGFKNILTRRKLRTQVLNDKIL